MDSLAFWEEVRRRRNHFFLVWVGWLVAGPALYLFYSGILPERADAAAPFLALGTWFAFWIYIQYRLTSLKCFACGGKAIGHAMFFMRHAKCISCGIKPSDGKCVHALPPNTSFERTREG
jgi:hypothetical protein